MITQEKINSLYGLEVVDNDGDKIGKIGAVWTDAVGRPTWASVKTGLFGLNESLFPLENADLRGDQVVVPFEKAKVKDAPNVDADHDEPLSQAEVDRLYEYYGVNWDESYNAYQAGSSASNASYSGTETRTDYSGTGHSGTGYSETGTTTTGRDRDAANLTGDDAMTRSEERLNVGTETEQAGRARLRKYVVTDHEQVSVPVSREEVRLEREPITEGNIDNALSGPDISEEEHEVILTEERPVVA
jgi:stress response protein YsnF